MTEARTNKARSTEGGLFVRGVAAILVAATAAAYWGSLHGAFVYDDLPSIRDNPEIRHFWPQGLVPGLTTSGRPVLGLSFAVNYALGGTSVWGYHALNVLIHVMAGLALFGVVRLTVSHNHEGEASSTRATLTAFTAALLWLLHPVQTEAVAYVAQRAESLMGLFFLLTLYCFIRANRARSPGHARFWYSTSAAACLCGMGTKEVMVSAPLLLLLYDRTFAGGSFANAWRERKGYYLSLAATWIFLVVFLAQMGGHRSSTSGFGIGLGWSAYLRTQGIAVAHYLRLFVWPSPLIFEYGPFWARSFGSVLPATSLVLVLAAGTAWALVRKPVVGFIGTWFFAILAPTSLVPGTLQMIAEHRMYLAIAPLAAIVAWALYRLPASEAVWITGALALALGLATASRVRVYRSDLALWSDTVAKRPQNPRAHSNLGEALRTSGNISAAITQYTEALILKPDFAEAHLNLGDALLQSGRPAEAVSEYQICLRLRPDLAVAQLNLAGAFLQEGHTREAIDCYQKALALDPGSFAGHYDFGNALFALGRTDEAVHEYLLALASDPSSFEAHYNVANALARLGHGPEALQHFEAALALRPNSGDTHFNEAGVLLKEGRTADAIHHFQEAVRLNPSDSAAREALSELTRSR